MSILFTLLSIKINGYIKESNRNKYLTLVFSEKCTLKKYEELWSKIRNLIRSITYCNLNSKLDSLHNTENYDQKYVKIKFNLDNDLSLKRR